VVLKRDRYVCQLKIDGICKYRADCVHHVYGRAVTGDNTAYLVASCTPCNLRTGDPTKPSRGNGQASGDPKPTSRIRYRDPDPRPRTQW
jgi:hypothetical protein